MHRDLGPGSEGRDVRQLEQALARAGFSPGSIDGRYDAATASAVAALYGARDEAPFGPTYLQAEQLRSAAAAAATARDALLQMRVALRTAEQGATPADINQARVDAAAAEELLPPARVAITTAHDKAATAQAAIDAAQLQESDVAATSGRDVAVADADVITKRAALNAAVDAQAEAQRQLAAATADTPPNEIETLRSALRGAVDKVGVAGADLTAAERTAEAARATPGLAVAKARSEGRLAARQLALAEAEGRDARASLMIAKRKLALAKARVRILQRPPGATLQRRIVSPRSREADRTRHELDRLAVRTGVQVPADEVLFFPSLPVRVDSVPVKRGSQPAGSVMTVSNSRLAIDASLSVRDAKLVRRGLRVRIEEADLGVRISGRVGRIANKPGTTPTDLAGAPPSIRHPPTSRCFRRGAPPSLVGTSVKLSIAVESTKGKVMAVPIGALSVGRRRQLPRPGRPGPRQDAPRDRVPGLAAQGFVEVRPAAKGKLNERDLVVVGSRPGAPGGPGPRRRSSSCAASVARMAPTRRSWLARRELLVERGDALAIVGPSGSGKSTCSTSSAAWTARPGAPTFDGIDVGDARRGRARGAARPADRLHLPDLPPPRAPDGARERDARPRSIRPSASGPPRTCPGAPSGSASPTRRFLPAKLSGGSSSGWRSLARCR